MLAVKVGASYIPLLDFTGNFSQRCHKGATHGAGDASKAR
jgi:hypothetical protein